MPTIGIDEIDEPDEDHVDVWLDTPCMDRDSSGEDYAKFFLEHKRMPAWKMNAFQPWMRQFKLFCRHQGNVYRVTGASRMGDIWLTSDYKQETGYEFRVLISTCSDWSPSPKIKQRKVS